MFKQLLWEDWLGLVVGAWLIASPWVLGYSDEMTPKLLAIVPGAALMSAELANVEGHTSAEEWIDVLIGAGLVIAPFAFGFDSETVPTANSIASGLAAMLLAGWALSPLDDSIRHWRGRRATRL